MGYLVVIMGPMFSGKTKLLIKKYNEYKSSSSAKAYNYYKDTRYGDDMIVSHDGTSISSVNLKYLTELFNDIKIVQDPLIPIFINEAQFFPDLKEVVIKLVEQYNKDVVICGLDSDYKREKFGQIWDLIPYADEIIKLYGNCNDCDNKSLFTYRVSDQTQQEVIGNNNYIPLCRSCYINKNNLLN